jgi:hypothetical protein
VSWLKDNVFPLKHPQAFLYNQMNFIFTLKLKNHKALLGRHDTLKAEVRKNPTIQRFHHDVLLSTIWFKILKLFQWLVLGMLQS